MRITKDPEIRRQEIIDAARELFILKGYEKTSIDDIVRHINVAKGLFYYYFPKKEAILSAIADQFVEEVTTSFPDDFSEPPEDFRTVIRHVLAFYLETVKKNEHLLNIRTSSGTVVSLYVRQRLEDHAIRRVTDLLVAHPRLLPLKYPEYTVKILVRGLGNLYLEGVQDLDVLTALIEEILGLPAQRTRRGEDGSPS